MKKTSILLLTTLSVMVLITTAGASEFRGNKFTLRIRKGLLYLNAHEASCGKILTAIERLTCVKIDFPQSWKKKRVSLTLKGIRLEAALKRMAISRAMVFEERNGASKLTRVIVVSNSGPDVGQIPGDLSRAASSWGVSELREPARYAPLPQWSHKRTSHLVPGELVVRFRKDLKTEEIGRVLSRFGATIRKGIPVLNYWVLTLPKEVPVGEAEKWLKQLGVVEQAEPNYLIPVAQVPDDPKFTLQWSLLNTGQSGGAPGADISAPEAWEIETGSPGVVIAVIDTGVDYSHPDLAANIWHNPGETADNNIDDDGNGYVDDIIGWDFVHTTNGCISGEDCSDPDNDPTDLHGHGTKVAGIAAAVANNDQGIAGVAWNCKIMVVRAGFKADDGSGLLEAADAASAIIYATDNGASVLNLSWGDTVSSEVVREAIQYALNRGVLVCAAAGNHGSDTPFYPAAMDEDGVIAVAATDNRDQLANFSNYGTWVDVGAPGDGILSTAVGGYYENTGGTSMATPHVSGLAALILSHYPGFKRGLVQDLILQNVDGLSSLDGWIATFGRINAASSLNVSLQNQTILISHFSTSFGSLSWEAGAMCQGDIDGDGDVDGLDLATLSLWFTLS